MKPGTRAFLWLALLALVGAATLRLLVLAGLPGVWAAMVHLTLFGWITAMITAINYHAMPVFAARDFPSTRPIWLHAGALGAGMLLATAGLLARIEALVAAGLGVQLAAALLFAANIITLFRRGVPRADHPPRPPIASQPQVDRIGTRATRLAGQCLPLALLLLLGAQVGWLRGEWVLAAEHLAALGWVMLMIVGVAYHMLPRFNGHGVRGPGWARAQVACHVGALLLMVPALGFGLSALFALGGLLMTAAVALFIWTIWPALQPFRLQSGAITLMLKER